MSRDLTDTIITAVATGTGRQIGDATAPDSPVFPYAVLWPLPSPDHDGDLEEPDRDRGWLYQFTSVGATRDQTQWMADKIRTSIETDTFAPSDVTIMNIESSVPGAVTRDNDTGVVTSPGDTASKLFYSVDVYAFWTTR